MATMAGFVMSAVSLLTAVGYLVAKLICLGLAQRRRRPDSY